MSFDFSALGLRTSEKTDSAATASKGRQTLGQQDFLTLLVTQLKNQDPLNPMENEAFVAQLAQFSTVSGITEMNGSLARISALAGNDSRSLAPQWLGRTVTGPDGISGKVASVAVSEDASLHLTLEDGSKLAVSAVTSLA
ncbi:flagellar hook assembly protein FlgD [Sandaracinobacteroides hominis]|uniref:flagellar hook assembly protein FlgD n=1 Tax=Sandaracinobacteroides hominis TaxID=2780086 RepID=UPI002E2922FE|nr:flagellar hook capping FlgD N-terminal domain-containing protein [Sandaracinobacteroides hominis]